jgi:putative Mg2+ transporter-C (MgtC) family protein
VPNFIDLTAQGLTGQGLLQVEELFLAFILSALVGLEREIHHKSAGLKTHTLVGVSAALFMLISKYGFMDILVYGKVVLDPSRVAAQVVSGIGFIGGGVIFMRRDVVRGLTTAAAIWFTAGLGMACGAGLPILALVTTAIHFIIMTVFPLVAEKLPRPQKLATEIQIAYQDGRGLLRTILICCTELRFAIDHVRLDDTHPYTERHEELLDQADREGIAVPKLHEPHVVKLSMLVKGKRPVSHLISKLSTIDGVFEVGKANEETE